MFNLKQQNYFRPIRTCSLVVYLIAALGYSAMASAQENYVVAGTAYNLENNKLVYRELYTDIDENKSVRVDYVTPEGAVFASKTLVYQGELFQPSFTLKDSRDNEVIAAQFEGPRLVLTHGMKTTRTEKIIYDNARMVIDAGFDAYIQLNWDKLMAGKRLTFDFALPNRLSSLQLEVRKIKAAESPVYDAGLGADWVYFRIVPAQKFVSLFADPINLAYDPNGKYLMRFHGRSNIDDKTGGPLDVRIEYEYAQ